MSGVRGSSTEAIAPGVRVRRDHEEGVVLRVVEIEPERARKAKVSTRRALVHFGAHVPGSYDQFVDFEKLELVAPNTHCEAELFEDDEHEGAVRWWRKYDEQGEFVATVALCDHHYDAQVNDLEIDLRDSEARHG